MIGYQASHEQFKPSELLDYAAQAKEAGFSSIHCSDHFHPWSSRQGKSGFAFSWLGASLQRTNLPHGSVCAPGQRYHPAIVAQAIATLGEMFPDRFWIALGSGEALNERITGDKWPAKNDRNARLLECVDIIRRLLAGETVSHEGRVIVEEARLYTIPKKSPPLFAAAVTDTTAAWAGSWADGLITVQQPYATLKKVVDAFRMNGGAGKPMYLKVQLSYAATNDEAMEGAVDQWRTNIFNSSVLADMWQVKQFDALGEMVQAKDMVDNVRMSADIRQHIDWLKQDADMGFQKIILHNVNRNQELFLQVFGDKVLHHFNH